MREIDVQDAASSLPTLLEELHTGEEIVLTQNGEGVAKLMPLARRKPVQLGRLAGKYKIPENFDEPLPDDLLDLFEGKP